MKVLSPLTSLSTYRGWMWLVMGGAMLMPYMMAAEVFNTAVTGRDNFGSPLLTVQVPAFVAVLPLIAATGLVLPVRLLSVMTARSLLNVSAPSTGAGRDWPRRWRDAVWFTLHLGLGGLVSGITLATVPFAVFIFALPFLSNRYGLAESLLSTGWQPWWGLGLGPASLVGLAYLACVVGAVLRWIAQRLLGPTAAEKLSQSRAHAANLAARNHVARELHDAVGHALSVVTIQSAAATRVIDTDPQFARRALSAIEDTARQALSELDTVLGILRVDAPGDTEPAHTLQQLPQLAATTGMDITVSTEAELSQLSPIVSRQAYRIIQESLTNALRYGIGGAATVSVAIDQGRLCITVTNPIDPSAGPACEGRGITGMRERVRVLGGTLNAGPASGQWTVVVDLPVWSQP